MKFSAAINIMPHKELLDPKGKAVEQNLDNLDLSTLKNVRIGKRITLSIDANNEDEAKTLVDKACKELLANTVMEFYEFDLVALN